MSGIPRPCSPKRRSVPCAERPPATGTRVPNQTRGPVIVYSAKTQESASPLYREAPQVIPVLGMPLQDWGHEIRIQHDEAPSHLDEQHLHIVLCFQSAIVTLLLLLFFALPLTMIAVGTLNLSNCKVHKGIPLCLMVGGCTYFVLPLLSAALDWNARNSYCPMVITVLGVVAAGASATGAVLVYRNAWPSADRNDVRYCDPVVYYFSFVMWTAFLVFVPVVLVVTAFVFQKYGKKARRRRYRREQRM
ncbi:uncharacterized protein LOC135365892 [Ornithodoros turicata]|uniref:uncharacterized protein LOC135365892 n=1 Tax=Ornithodoros turicata TaxID=34597 RepID=UPI003138AF37